MSDIILGTNFKLYYNTDTGNTSPQGIDNVLINELAAFPILSLVSETTSFDTYDSDYVSKLLSDKSMEDLSIVVNYISTDPTHQFLDEAANNQTEFQLVLQYYFDIDASQIAYGIVNGYISASSLTGDKDSVVQKNYNFTHSQVIARSMVAKARLPLLEGDFGVGSDGIDIDQYSPDIPTGNSFIKIPSAQTGNPASADMMGIGWTDNNQVCEFAVTKSGALGIYAKNASTAWTRIYTVTQSDLAYVPMARTVNGKALSANITLTKADVGLGTVTDNPQLKIASNLSDLANVATARTNLSVYSKAEIDADISAINASIATASDEVIDLDNKVTTIETDIVNLDDKFDTMQTDITENYVPIARTVNGHNLSTDITLEASDLGLGSVLDVPSYSKTESDTIIGTLVTKATTVNGKALTGNITLEASDLGLGSVLDVPSYSKTESDTIIGTLVKKTTTVNGKALSGNITLTKADVGLSTVTDNPQLKIASNLSDLANVATARTNLGLGTAAVQNIGTSGDNVPLMSTANTWAGVQTFIGRTFVTNLASTTAGTYNGTANVTQGVSGILPLANGGTGSVNASDSRTALGVAYGTTAGTVAQGNDSRLNTINGKSGGTVNGAIATNGGGISVTNNPQSIAYFSPASNMWQESTNAYRNVMIQGDVVTGTQYGLMDFLVNNNAGTASIRLVPFASPTAFYTFQFDHTGQASARVFTPTSDERLKEHITVIPDALSKMDQINGVTFNYKDSGIFGIGFIAQDVERVFPDAVSSGGALTLQDGTVIDDVKRPDTYGVAAALHHEAIKELHEMIIDLQNQIEEIKNK